MGENIQNLDGLAVSLNKMIDHIQVILPNSKILITGTFWKNVPVNDIFVQVANQRHLPFVKLSQLDLNENISSIGSTVLSVDGLPYKITNQAVAGHPGDQGMLKMAEAIFQGIQAMMQQTISR
ncbi:MAG: hypothetical protein EOO88_38000 [Pedobacter sp.]|nr:MAG: hypothetical protein EOO88_38000 [Pedobacter sp.]